MFPLQSNESRITGDLRSAFEAPAFLRSVDKAGGGQKKASDLCAALPTAARCRGPHQMQGRNLPSQRSTDCALTGPAPPALLVKSGSALNLS